ncbi:histidinol dehydrogenase [Psychrosphaera aestuarii]|uniref:histidinol dehydrogenase n=1 Tax=Psychrosphaera aestuarii TaxID=1266052 RepID=UPI001B32B1AD|nr:histidinol dehydrogenase [Psychrosphaera aestuarii]
MITWQDLTLDEQKDALARPAIANRADLTSKVADIIQLVKDKGDEALLELTAKFDGLTLDSVALPQEQADAIIATLGAEQKAAIELAYGQIKRFHEAQVQPNVKVETSPGVVCELITQAISSVGLYIPGGSAPLPSTVLMLGVPAQIAGCKRTVLCTPPDTSANNKGGVTAEILYAAKLCGINEIYRTGGAQAVAAMAYGTNSIAAVDKIFGPGNSFVTEAKQLVAQDPAGAAIDMPAGPSEVLVLADANANSAFVAADLLSQAEHGPDSQVILVSDSQILIEKTKQDIESQLTLLPRAEIAKKALANSRFILASSLENAVQISNQYAPEHLIVQFDNARDWLGKLDNAASVFLGAYTPESAGDYASGTNHVLPTYGYSKVLSSLNLADFTRKFTVQEITPSGLQAIGPAIMTLAAAEGLDAHRNAVGLRLDALTAKLDTLNDSPVSDSNLSGTKK